MISQNLNAERELSIVKLVLTLILKHSNKHDIWNHINNYLQKGWFEMRKMQDI